MLKLFVCYYLLFLKVSLLFLNVNGDGCCNICGGGYIEFEGRCLHGELIRGDLLQSTKDPYEYPDSDAACCKLCGLSTENWELIDPAVGFVSCKKPKQQNLKASGNILENLKCQACKGMVDLIIGSKDLATDTIQDLLKPYCNGLLLFRGLCKNAIKNAIDSIVEHINSGMSKTKICGQMLKFCNHNHTLKHSKEKYSIVQLNELLNADDILAEEWSYISLHSELNISDEHTLIFMAKHHIILNTQTCPKCYPMKLMTITHHRESRNKFQWQCPLCDNDGNVQGDAFIAFNPEYQSVFAGVNCKFDEIMRVMYIWSTKNDYTITNVAQETGVKSHNVLIDLFQLIRDISQYSINNGGSDYQVTGTTSRENNLAEELCTKFYKKITEDTSKIMEEFKNALLGNVEAKTCRKEEEPDKIYPWNDKSHWSRADDRLISSAFDGKLKLTDNQKTWLKIIPTDDPKAPRLACRICQNHLRRNKHLSPEKFGYMAREEGAFYDAEKSSQTPLQYWRTTIAGHEAPHAKGGTSLRNHARIILEMKNEILEPKQSCLNDAHASIRQNKMYTSRVFLTAFTLVKTHIAFRLYPTLIKLLQSSNALPSTVKHGNRRSLGRIVNTISRTMRVTLIATIKIVNPPVTIILDTSSDKQCRQYLIVFMQIAVDITPKVYLYKVIELKGESAMDMKTALLKAFEEDGITKIVKETLVGFASDGAANMVGIRGGLGTLMEEWIHEPPVAIGRRAPIFRVHCHSHRLQLSLKNVMKALTSFSNLHWRFESTVNGLYSFYSSHSVKRSASLKKFAKKYDHKLLQVRSIIKIRWISSQFPAIKTLKSNYYLYLFHLNSLSTDESFANDHTTQSTATGYYNELNTLDFALYMHFVIDILRPINDLCQSLQKKLYSVTQLHNDIKQVVARLDDLNHHFGDSLQTFIDLLKCKKNNEDVPCTVQLFNDRDQSVIISLPMVHFFEGELPEDAVIFTRRPQRINLETLRDSVVPALINELNSRFPENPLVIEQLGTLEPSTLPMGINGVQTYANTLQPLVARFGGADQHIINQCVEVLTYLLQNDRDKYFQNQAMDMSSFWKYAITVSNKMGHVEVGDLKPFISKILAMSPGSVIVEQAFSTFFYTKHTRRSRLSTTSLNDIMNLMINGPSPEAFDPLPSVGTWLSEGHHESYDATMIDEATGLLAPLQLPIERFLDENPELQQVDWEEEDDDGTVVDDDTCLIDEIQNEGFAVFTEDLSDNGPMFPDDYI